MHAEIIGDSVSVSCGCGDRWPRRGWLTTAETYSLMVPKGRAPNRAASRAAAPPETLGGDPSRLFQRPLAPGHLWDRWSVAASLQCPPPSAPGTLLCVSVRPTLFLSGHQVAKSRAHPHLAGTQPHLITFAKTSFLNQVMF